LCSAIQAGVQEAIQSPEGTFCDRRSLIRSPALRGK